MVIPREPYFTDNFDSYGSLYQPSSDFMYEIPGSHKAKVLDGASPEEKQLIESQFYIGPSCEPRLFQRDGRHLMEEYHGPCMSFLLLLCSHSVDRHSQGHLPWIT